MGNRDLGDSVSVLAVEIFPAELHVFQLETGEEYVFWEGGCELNKDSEVELFNCPYNTLIKKASVPVRLLSDLKNNMLLINPKPIGYRISEQEEAAERNVLQLERRLAKILQKQGVDLRDYFESYRGTTIN